MRYYLVTLSGRRFEPYNIVLAGKTPAERLIELRQDYPADGMVLVFACEITKDEFEALSGKVG